MLHGSSMRAILSTYLIFLKISITHNPQPTNVFLRDNKCAVGVATDTAQAKRSKAIDMRWPWIRDRVRQGLFDVYWCEGSINLADFYTKALPYDAHHMIMPYIVSSSDK